MDSGYLLRQWRWPGRLMPWLLALLWFAGLGSVPAAQALVILQYHHVSDSTPAATSIAPENFAAHMAHLAASGFDVISLPALLQRVAQGQPLPDRTALITFDDAYHSILQTAHPILQKYRWPYVVFVSPEAVDQGVRDMLSWAELRQLAGDGVAIANHSERHAHLIRRLDGEAEAQWRRRIRADIEQAQNRIRAEVAQDYRVLAFPYGEYDAALLDLLRAMDYLGFGQQSGAATLRDVPALPRFPFGGRYVSLADFAQKLQSLPLPLTDVALWDERDQPLQDGVLPPSVRRPKLALTLAEPALAASLACYVSQQGRAHVVSQRGATAVFQAAEPLRPGRARYNCTAASAVAGRYHWFSMPFISRDRAGGWAPEP